MPLSFECSKSTGQKMLYVYFIVLSLIGLHVYGAAIQSNDKLIGISARLANVIQKKCLKNANETISTEVLEDLTILKGASCWGSVNPQKIDSTANEISQYCHDHKPDIVKCLTRFGEKLEPCLTSDETYLKEFMLAAFDKYSNYYCDNLHKIRGDLSSMFCISEFISNPETDPNNVCYAQSEVFGDDPSVDLITKENLCGDLSNIRSCYAELFDKHCPRALGLKELHQGMQKEALTVCADVL